MIDPRFADGHVVKKRPVGANEINEQVVIPMAFHAEVFYLQ